MNVKQRTVFVVAALLMLLSAGCTDYNLEDTGLADGNHNTTMLEYFKGDPYNFDSLQVMIRHAGLEDIFEGKSQYGNNITCFGITNHSIRRYMLENEITSIQDMPVDECRRMVLDCVTAQRIMLDDVPEGAPSTDLETPIGTGGETITMLSGKRLWIYTYRDTYNDVPKAGPKRIYIVSEETTKSSKVASHNITTNIGVVHSLVYDFTLGDF